MKILVADHVDDSCLSVLRNHGFEMDWRPEVPGDLLRSLVSDCDALIVRSGTSDCEGDGSGCE